MENYIDMVVRGITKNNLKEILIESGLKKRLLKGDFSNGKVSVSVKEISPYSVWGNYSLGISAENIEEAANLYNLILEKSEKIRFGIESNLYMENEK